MIEVLQMNVLWKHDRLLINDDIVGVVRRSLESWWRQPTFQRACLALIAGDSGEYLRGWPSDSRLHIESERTTQNHCPNFTGHSWFVQVGSTTNQLTQFNKRQFNKFVQQMLYSTAIFIKTVHSSVLHVIFMFTSLVHNNMCIVYK